MSQNANSRLQAVSITVLTLVLLDAVLLFLVWLSTFVLETYSWGLFVLLPFVFGLATAWVANLLRPRDAGECTFLAFIALVIAAFVALVIGFEGVICLVMASPLIIFLTLAGCWVGVLLLPREHLQKVLPVMLVLTPLLMGFEAAIEPEPPLYAVKTAVEIDAPPEVVWHHVVSFSEIMEPEDWIFKTGLAYPITARIEGSGVGAIRYCVFSSGAFVEPIEVWDAPRLLRFTVTENPPPMQEWNPFHDTHPPHLDGFLTSRRGQFLLEPLPGGGTRLEGTTWYQHGLWPATYWRWWSDAIIHRIHERVLNHVASLAEGA